MFVFNVGSFALTALSLFNHVVPTTAVSLAGDSVSHARRQSSTSSSVYATRFTNVTWDNDNWILNTTDLNQQHFQARLSLANGYIGINVAALGPFFDVDLPQDGDVLNGWPLFDRRQSFATIGGFWDSQPSMNGTNYPWLSQYGWDTAISGIPHWSDIILDLGNGNILNASTSSSQISGFSTSLDMKQGIANWAFVWSPPGSSALDISYQMFVHKLQINQAFIQLNVTARNNTNATVVNVLNGDCATRTNFTSKGTDADCIYSAVNPEFIQNVTGYVYANVSVIGADQTGPANNSWNAPYIGNNQSSIASALFLRLQAGETATITKFVGIASSDGYMEPQQAARDAATSARSTGYTASLQSHAQEWASLLPATSVDDFSYPTNGSLPSDPNVIETAIMAVANPFYLLQNTISQNAIMNYSNNSVNSHSISVGGLGSDSYAGQIFWDAETWMQPGIVPTFPFSAQGIANYRVARYGQAQANIKTAYQSSKNHTYFSSEGAIYPWTSGRSGNCTATGPCWDYEYHINGDIAQEFLNYWLASGDTDFFKDNLLPIYSSIATMYSNLLQKNGSDWILTNMTDPDEFANNVDNGGYTMALVATILQNANDFLTYFNASTNSTWNTQAENVAIGRNKQADIVLEFTGMNGTVDVKQADVVLVTYPLDYSGMNYTATDSLSDLDYYASKQSQAGPAMTYGIFSIIANLVSPSGCSSYTYQLYSTEPYARAPWFQLSEQLIDDFNVNGGFHPAFPFLTGHGGANQVVLYGYLGLRLTTDYMLYIDPSLPPQIPQIRYRTFHWHGWPITAFSNQTHTTLSRAHNIPPAAGAVPNSTYATTAIPVAVGPVQGTQQTFSLAPNSTLTVANRQPGLNKTTPGNLAQCQPITTDSDIVPGQFAQAAVDGATSTLWQPVYANKTASITVQLEPGLEVLGMLFDWAAQPAFNYSISFSNSSSGAGAQTIVNNATVSISNPYDPADEAVITAPTSNSSELWLNGTQVHTNATLQVKSLFTSTYATLSIWGNLNMSQPIDKVNGSGATVAEWSIIVANGSNSSSSDQKGVRATARAVDDTYLMGLKRRADDVSKRWHMLRA